MLEITGVHGGGFYPDGTLHLDTANRVEKGLELLRSGETELLVMLGIAAPYMRAYAVRKFPYINKRKILVEGKGRSSLEETKNFKLNFVDPYGYKNIGKVSQAWYLPRIKLIDSKIFPPSHYNIKYFEAEDGRTREEIEKDVKREKLVYQIDRIRLKLLPLSTSTPVEKFLELGEKLYEPSLKVYDAAKKTLKDKEMWKEWLLGFAIYLGPWNLAQAIGGNELRKNVHELEEWVNFGYTVPLLFPLSSPLRKFIENLRGNKLDYKHQYLLEIGSALAWKGIQHLGRCGLIPIIPPYLWEGEGTDYPSLIFDNLESLLKIKFSETSRDMIRIFSLGSISSYLRKKLSRLVKEKDE